MSYEFPLVIFTVLSQAAVGVAIFLCWNLYTTPVSQDRETLRKSWLWICILAACGLIASLFHLGHPFQAWKALYNLGDSWLSREAFGFDIFCILALICVFYPTRPLGVITCLVGVYSLVAQGFTYAPPSIPALNNLLPMALFWLSALALGACALTMLKSARLAMLALIVTLLAGPVIWISGTPTMQESSLLWITSPWFWTGFLLVCGAFIASWLPSINIKLQFAALLCGILCTRMVFFADTAHTAANMGLPFS